MTASPHIGGPRALCMGSSERFNSREVKRCTEALSMSFEKFFKMRFAEFLQENFDNPTQAAVAFHVRERTAENWWDGINAPSGPKVARAFRDYPGSATRLLIGEENEAVRALRLGRGA